MDGLPIRGMLWLIGLIILNALTEAMITALQNVNEPGAEKPFVMTGAPTG